MVERQQHLVMRTQREFRLASGAVVLALHGSLLLLALWHYSAQAVRMPPPAELMAALQKEPPPPPPVMQFKPLKLVVAPVDLPPPPDITIAADPQPPRQEGRVVPPPPVIAAPPPPAPSLAAPPQPVGDLNAYLVRLSARIQQFLQNPGEMQGTVLVHLRFGSDGKVTVAELAKSSGNIALDREALAVMWRAQPMPAIPADLKRDEINGVVPVRFTLRH